MGCAASACAEAIGSPTAPKAIRSANAVAMPRPRTGASVLQRFIHQLLYFALDPLPFRGSLLQQDEQHVLPGIDDEVAAAGAVPFQFAERPRRRRFGVAGIGANAKTQAETKPVAREIIEVARHAGLRPDPVRGQRGKILGAQIALAV